MSEPAHDLPPEEPEVFDQPDLAAEERAMAEAEAELDAGKGVPHAEVAKWLRTWGTADFKAAPAEWFE